MVSLWPWKGDTSAASFEKTLSQLATKITKASAKNDSLRQSSRRVKVMWTLYSTFAYTLAVLVLTLVTGWSNWGPVEYTSVAGSPLVIYGIRKGLTAYYSYRISNTQAYLDRLYKERDATIEKLKQATKYDTTQQLLEKYGSPRPSGQSEPSQQQKGKRKPQGGSQQPGERTNLPPPPTANIPRNPAQLPQPPPAPPGPQRSPSASQPQGPPPSAAPQHRPSSPGAEFAPNAYPSEPQYAPLFSGPKWYDRIIDSLLGEDETQPRNRFALICTHCRLVNGQAPPGTKSPTDVGRWRCGGCGGWNGEESEVKKGARMGSDVPVTLHGRETDDDAEDGGTESGEEVIGPGSATSEGDPSVGSSVDLIEDVVEPEPPVRMRKGKGRKGKKH